MARIIPQNTDSLSNPPHAFLHRVITVDGNSAQSTIDVDGSNNTSIGTLDTNNTKFDSTGHQTMNGTGKPWRDEITDALSIKNTGTAGVVVDPAEGTLTFTHGAGLTDYAYCNMQLNHDKDLTSTIYPHIHFLAAEQSVVPNFMLQYRWQISGVTKVTSWTNYKCNTMLLPAPAALATNHNLAGNNTGIAVPDGSNISDIVQFRIIRDHNNDNSGHFFDGNDPYTATVHVLAFDAHFMINSLGSTDQYTK